MCEFVCVRMRVRVRVHAPLEAGMGRKKWSTKTTYTGGYPGHWGCQKCIQEKNWMGKF